MADLITAGVLLILAGFAFVVVSLVVSSRKGGSTVKGGGVVIIGPVPIIFGSDSKWASVAMVLAIILFVLTVLFYVVRL